MGTFLFTVITYNVYVVQIKSNNCNIASKLVK